MYWLIYWLMNEQWNLDYRLSTALSWLAAVVFAYVVNKLIVFRNYQFKPSHLWKEWCSFFTARALSGVLVMLMMIAMVDMLHWGEFRIGEIEAGLYLAKAVVSAVNLVVNILRNLHRDFEYGVWSVFEYSFASNSHNG